MTPLLLVPFALVYAVYRVLSACGIVSKGWKSSEGVGRYMK